MEQGERAIARISRAEMERRWSLVRAHLAERGVDALITTARGHDTLAGYVRWLSGRPQGGYLHVLIFPARDPMISIEHGAMGRRQSLDGDDPERPGQGELITTASIGSVDYTKAYEAEIAAEVVRRRGYRKLALAGGGAMPFGFVSGLREILGEGVEWSDETEFLDRCKAIKSAEEIAAIVQTARMQDEVFQRVLAQIRPGMRDVEITSLARHEGNRIGSEGNGVFLGGSASPGHPAPILPQHLQGRRIGQGDQFTLLIENNGAAGYYAELARVIVFGKASSQLSEAFAACREAQHQTVSQFRPGAACRDIHQSYIDYLKAVGMPPELRLYCHGQGLDLVERPLVRHDEQMRLGADMFLACHPGYTSPSLFCFICDNYFVGRDGPSECVHRTPKQIFEL
jgi:Xaa-Pro aminopeptidase